MPATLEITDGTDTVSLIQDGGNAFFLNDWMPRIALPKGGGVYQQSALSDGRRLVDRRFDNVSESFDMKGRTEDMDAMARELQVLRGLLEKAVAYWTADWQSTPVYFVCQAECETNARYALIVNYSTPNDENPFSQPWLTASGVVLDDWILTIERDHWTENAPGTGTAVAISAVEEYNAHNYGNVDSSGVREPTTDNEVYVANKQNEANITHIYVDNGGVFGGNLLGSGVPYDLLPAVPALNDAVYFGIRTALADSGPFASLVFDLSVAQNDCELRWEYWDGAAWSLLSTQDNTRTTEPFDTTGVNGVHWEHPDDWATTAVNGVTGYWVRARIDAAVGAAPSPPTQQNRDIYTITWAYTQIQANQVSGAIPALAFMRLFEQTHSAVVYGQADTVFAGLRSISRGDDFSAYINLADEQNPTGITVSVIGGTTSFVTSMNAPSGRLGRYNPAGVEAMGTELLMQFTSEISRQYYGTFHIYMRVLQTGGATEDFEVRLLFDFGGILYTDSVPVIETTSSEGEVLDFGQITLPVPGRVKTDEYVILPSISVQASNSNAAPGDLDFIDLILFPVDEFAVRAREDDDLHQRPRYLDIDSVTHPRAYIRSALREEITVGAESEDGIEEMWQTIANNQAILQTNANQKMWFFRYQRVDSPVYPDSAPEGASKIQLRRNQRYFSYRGDQ